MRLSLAGSAFRFSYARSFCVGWAEREVLRTTLRPGHSCRSTPHIRNYIGPCNHGTSSSLSLRGFPIQDWILKLTCLGPSRSPKARLFLIDEFQGWHPKHRFLCPHLEAFSEEASSQAQAVFKHDPSRLEPERLDFFLLSLKVSPC